MNAELRVIAVSLALVLPGLVPAVLGYGVPVLRVGDPEPTAAAPMVSFSLANYTRPSPTVSISVPKYQITALERETVAACLILEAASQGDFGMRGVMAVIRNRARGLPELFSPTVLRHKQFSALNNVTEGRETLRGAIQRASRDRMWPIALAIVDDALHEQWYDPTNGATHYTRSVESTNWTRRLAMTVKIGAHSFYR